MFCHSASTLCKWHTDLFHAHGTPQGLLHCEFQLRCLGTQQLAPSPRNASVTPPTPETLYTSKAVVRLVDRSTPLTSVELPYLIQDSFPRSPENKKHLPCPGAQENRKDLTSQYLYPGETDLQCCRDEQGRWFTRDQKLKHSRSPQLPSRKRKQSSGGNT